MTEDDRVHFELNELLILPRVYVITRDRNVVVSNRQLGAKVAL